jgi:hypothetical protein
VNLQKSVESFMLQVRRCVTMTYAVILVALKAAGYSNLRTCAQLLRYTILHISSL